MVCKFLLQVCLTILIGLVLSATGQSSKEYYWSLCNNADMGELNCRNGFASDEWVDYINATYASVKGFFVFISYGRNDEPTGLAQFVFQESVGVYEHLTVAAESPITSLKMLGVYNDHKTSAISIAFQKELITDGVARIVQSQGSVEDCNYGGRSRSFVLHGNEPWHLVGSNGRSICVQVANTTSFVPGVIRDVTELGFVDDFKNICAFIKGCPDSGSVEMVLIPNSETTGVLRR